MADLRANTAVDVLIGPFVDITDGNTTEDALTITAAEIKLSKNGQALTLKSDVTSATFDDDGYYNCELDATDTNTEGTLVLIVHQSANALPVRHEFNILCEAAWDSMYVAKDTGFMDVNVKAVSEDTTAADNAEAFFDGTGYAGTNNVIPTVTTLTGHTAQTGDSYARIGAAGASLTNINLPNQTMDITGNITGNLSGSVGSVTGAVGSVTGSVGSVSGDTKQTADVAALITTVGAAGVGLTEAGGTGDHLTAINLPNQTMDITGNLSGSVGSVSGAVGSVSGAVGSVTGSVGSVAGNVDGNVTGSVASVGSTVSADVVSISGDTAAADNLEASMETIVTGTVTGAETTTTIADSALTAGLDNDNFLGRIIIFRSAATNIPYQATDITGYNGTTKVLTFTALTQAPTIGDAYVIL